MHFLPRHRPRSVNSLHQAQTARRNGRNLLRETIQTAGFIVLVFTIMTVMIGRFEIQQTSMAPNFRPGQGVIVSQLDWAFGNWLGESVYAAHPTSGNPLRLQHGQVVVFYETAELVDPPLIKRLIGLPGDRVEIRDGKIYINGMPQDEPYLNGIKTDCSTVCGPLTLGPDEYFFMGDNRPVSRDSRDFGPIAGAQILGRVVVRFWPLNELSLFW